MSERAALALVVGLLPLVATAQHPLRPQAWRVEIVSGRAGEDGRFVEAGFGLQGLHGPRYLGARALGGLRLSQAACDTPVCAVESYQRWELVGGYAWRAPGVELRVGAGPTIRSVERRGHARSVPVPGVAGEVGADLFPASSLGLGLRAFGVVDGVRPMAGGTLSLVVRIAARDDSAARMAVPHRALFPDDGDRAAPHWRLAQNTGFGGGPGEPLLTASFDVQHVTGPRVLGGRLSAAVPFLLCFLGCEEEEYGVVTLDAVAGHTRSGRRSGSLLTVGPSLVYLDRPGEGVDMLAPGLAATMGADFYPSPGVGLGVQVAGNLNRPVSFLSVGAGLRARVAR